MYQPPEAEIDGEEADSSPFHTVAKYGHKKSNNQKRHGDDNDSSRSISVKNRRWYWKLAVIVRFPRLLFYKSFNRSSVKQVHNKVTVEVTLL